jgi:hypothetical protein
MQSNIEEIKPQTIAGVPNGTVCVAEGSYSPSGLMEQLCNGLDKLNENIGDDNNLLKFEQIELKIVLKADGYIQNGQKFPLPIGLVSGGNINNKTTAPIVIRPIPPPQSTLDLINEIDLRLAQIWPEYAEIFETTIDVDWQLLEDLLQETKTLRDQRERLLKGIPSHQIIGSPNTFINLNCEKDENGNFIYQEEIDKTFDAIMSRSRDRIKNFYKEKIKNPNIEISFTGETTWIGNKKNGNKRQVTLGTTTTPVISRPFTPQEAPSLYDPEPIARPAQFRKPPNE